MKKCPVCNMSLPDDSDFCQYCGTKIVIAAEPVENAAVKKPAVVPAAEPKKEPKTESAVPQTKANVSTDKPKLHEKKTRKAPEKQSKRRGKLAAVIVLVLALIGLNVWQYLNSQDEIANVSSLKEKIENLKDAKLDLDEEVDELKYQVSSLEQELESTKKDNTDLKNTITSLNSTITSLKAQITTLTNEKNTLQTKNTTLTNENAKAKNALNIYNAMKSFSSSFNSDYFSTFSIVVVRVGGSQAFDIYSSLNTTLYVQGSNDNSDVTWGTWNYNKCSVTVTGKAEGTTTYTFTNAANNHQFKVLVVIIPW